METRFFPLLLRLYQQTLSIFFRRFWSFLFFAVTQALLLLLILSLYWWYYHSWNLMWMVVDPLVAVVLLVGGLFLKSLLELSWIYMIFDRKAGVWKGISKAFWRWIPFFFLHLWLLVLILGHVGLFFIPGLILALYLSLSFYTFVDNKMGIFESMRLSTYLVSKSFWFVLGSCFVTGVLLCGMLFVPYLNFAIWLFSPLLVCIFGSTLYIHLKTMEKHIRVPEMAFGWKVLFSILGFAFLGIALIYWLQSR